MWGETVPTVTVIGTVKSHNDRKARILLDKEYKIFENSECIVKIETDKETLKKFKDGKK